MSKETTSGPINGVRCPHCGKNNDFRMLHDQQLLDTGHKFDCDHCKRLMEVVRIAPVLVVSVRPATGRATHVNPSRNLPAPREARTLSPAQTRKLLRGR